MKTRLYSEKRSTDTPPILVRESSLTQIRSMAKTEPGMTFTSLAHRIDLSLPGKSFRQLRKNTATGVDKVTAEEYSDNLDANLYKLYLRLKRGQLWSWCKDNLHESLREQHETLSSKLRGFYQYFGVRGNFKVLEVVYEYATKAWKHWLGRRHRNGKLNFKKFSRLLNWYPLPRPRIVHNI